MFKRIHLRGKNTIKKYMISRKKRCKSITITANVMQNLIKYNHSTGRRDFATVPCLKSALVYFLGQNTKKKVFFVCTDLL